MNSKRLANHALEVLLEMIILFLVYGWIIVKSGGYASWGALIIIPAIIILPNVLSIPIVIIEIIKKDYFKFWQILIIKFAIYLGVTAIIFFINLGN